MDKVTYMFLTLMAKIRSIVSDIADIRKSSAAGAPTKVTKASEMTDTDKNYLYLGTESGYNSGHIYYFVEGVLTDGGAYGGVNVDDTLTISGQAADAKVTGDKIEEIKEDLLQISEYADMEVRLANQSNWTKINAFISLQSSGNVGISQSTTAMSVYFPCVENTTYLIKKTASKRFRAGYTEEKPKFSSTPVKGYVDGDGASSVQVITGAGAKYIAVYYYSSSADTDSETTIFNSIYVSGLYSTAEDQVARAYMVSNNQRVSALENSMNQTFDDVKNYFNNIKNPLIALFRKMIAEDESVPSLINNLVSAFDGGQTIPDHVVLKGTALSTIAGNLVRVYVAENLTRASILSVFGTHKLRYYDAQTQTETGDSLFYPIPIPQGAKYITVDNIIETLYGFSATITKYDDSTGKWSRILPGQWVWVDGPVGVEGQEDAPLVPYKWDISDYNDGTYYVVIAVAAVDGTTLWKVDSEVPDGLWVAHRPASQSVRDDVSTLVPVFYFDE